MRVQKVLINALSTIRKNSLVTVLPILDSFPTSLDSFPAIDNYHNCTIVCLMWKLINLLAPKSKIR